MIDDENQNGGLKAFSIVLFGMALTVIYILMMLF
jgi:hypothetical protein